MNLMDRNTSEPTHHIVNIWTTWTTYISCANYVDLELKLIGLESLPPKEYVLLVVEEIIQKKKQ